MLGFIDGQLRELTEEEIAEIRNTSTSSPSVEARLSAIEKAIADIVIQQMEGTHNE